MMERLEILSRRLLAALYSFVVFAESVEAFELKLSSLLPQNYNALLYVVKSPFHSLIEILLGRVERFHLQIN